MGAVVTDAEAVAHAVETREVGRHFAWENQIVGRKCGIKVRAIHLNNRGALGFKLGHSLVELLQNSLLVAVPVELFDHSDAHAGKVTGHSRTGSLNDGGDGTVHRCGVKMVRASDNLVKQRRVQHSARRGSALVQGGCTCDQAVSGHGTVGRLNAHSVGQRSGLANRTARIRADSQWRFTSGKRC